MTAFSDDRYNDFFEVKPRIQQRAAVEIIVNGENRQVAEAVTIAGLLSELSLTGRYVAVEVNREVVPRARHEQYRLSPGDRLEIVTLVGGG